MSCFRGCNEGSHELCILDAALSLNTRGHVDCARPGCLDSPCNIVRCEPPGKQPFSGGVPTIQNRPVKGVAMPPGSVSAFRRFGVDQQPVGSAETLCRDKVFARRNAHRLPHLDR